MFTIEINDKQEYEALMQDMEEKCWVWNSGHKPTDYDIIPPSYPCYIQYNNHFIYENTKTNSINFKEFLELTGIKFKQNEIIIKAPFTRFIVTSKGFSVETDTGEESNVGLMSGKYLEQIYEAYITLKNKK